MESSLNEQVYIEVGINQLVENIKILLYKENQNIFNQLDFDNDSIYQEPLLFAYFNSEKQDGVNLDTILYGYIKPELRPNIIQVKSDEFGRVYLPNLGWLLTNKRIKYFELSTVNEKLILTSKGKRCSFVFEPLEVIDETNIELLKYPLPLLKQCYFDVDQNLIDVEIENISELHKENVTKAWNLIKKLTPRHYELICSVTKKCVVFNVETTLRNSFATLSAQGIGFFNAYQKDYNEVFFVDDIAHQTGHIIFNALIYEVAQFIKVDPSTAIQTMLLGNNTTETRDIYILFHALYTYYTTFICLDACLDANTFKNEKKHEALGRMNFYLTKCYQDINLIESTTINSNSEGAKGLFTEDGLKIYFEIKNKFNSMINKWKNTVKTLDMSNQPYNFTYSKFIELNPFHENNH